MENAKTTTNDKMKTYNVKYLAGNNSITWTQTIRAYNKEDAVKFITGGTTIGVSIISITEKK